MVSGLLLWISIFCFLFNCVAGTRTFCRTFWDKGRGHNHSCWWCTVLQCCRGIYHLSGKSLVCQQCCWVSSFCGTSLVASFWICAVSFGWTGRKWTLQMFSTRRQHWCALRFYSQELHWVFVLNVADILTVSSCFYIQYSFVWEHIEMLNLKS